MCENYDEFPVRTKMFFDVSQLLGYDVPCTLYLQASHTHLTPCAGLSSELFCTACTLDVIGCGRFSFALVRPLVGFPNISHYLSLGGRGGGGVLEDNPTGESCHRAGAPFSIPFGGLLAIAPFLLKQNIQKAR